jgi:RNA polymerase sigma-70 factor, ECF subfamily
MASAGDRNRNEWFCEQVDNCLPELYGTARRLTSHDADAEDLVADAVARAWEHLHTLEDDGAFRGWVFRIMTNRFISLRRKQGAHTADEAFDEESHAPEPSFSLFEQLHQPFLLWWSSPEQSFLRRLLRDDLDRAVNALPVEFRAAVLLCDVQGLSYRETAEALDVPIGTIKSRLARGRSLLQHALWEHGRDAGLIGNEMAHRGEA